MLVVLCLQDDFPERVAELLANYVQGKEIMKKGSIKRAGDATE